MHGNPPLPQCGTRPLGLGRHRAMSPSFHVGLFCRVLVMPNRASQPGMAETRGLASSVLSVAPCHFPARLPDFPSTSPRPRAPPRPPITPFHAPPCMTNLVGVADVIMSTPAGLRPVALWHPHGTYTKGVCNGGPFGISPPTALPPKVRTSFLPENRIRRALLTSSSVTS